jgi:hypothetical protein
MKAGVEENRKDLHRNYPGEKAGKAKPGQDRKVLILQSAERDDPDDNRNGHRSAGDHVANIAMKEATAVFCFDALCKALADL